MKLHLMLTTAAPALALVLLLPQAASAALLESGTFTDSYGPQISYCGEPFEQAGVSTGRYQVVSEGLDRLPHMLVQARDADTWTNTITGGRVSVESQYMGRDIAVTDNGDGTLTEVVQFTGVTVMYDENGVVLARAAAGILRVAFVFDHAGTPTDISDDEFLSRTVLIDNRESFDFCGTIAAAIG